MFGKNMRLLGTVGVILGFMFSLYCSAIVLWSGRIQVSRYSERVAIRSEDPAAYWITASLVLMVTVVSGFGVRLVLLSVKPSKRIHLDSVSFRKRK